MRIDPKYFNQFLLIIAIIAAGLITFFMLNNRSNEKSQFKDRMFAQDSLRSVSWSQIQRDDSLHISDFEGSFVVLDFWSNWTNASLESHKQLAQLKNKFPDTLEILAAAVRLKPNETISYIEKHNFPFHFVEGTQHFSGFNIPGLPAQLIYNPQGQLQNVYLGYQNDSQYDSLRARITDGRK